MNNMEKNIKMKNKRILIVGFFGFKNNQLDGQTVKTRNVYYLMRERKKSVDFFDTQLVQSSKTSLLDLLWKLLVAKHIIIIPAGNMLKKVFPFVFIVSKLLGKKVIYIPVGGWLSWYIKDKRLIQYMLGHITAILPESNDEVMALTNDYGFHHVVKFPNFRISAFTPTFMKTGEDKSLRILFLARIHKMKGLDIMFYLAEKIKVNRLQNVIIDFYGPFNEEDRAYFQENVNKYDFVSYKGVLSPENINHIVSQYDVMVFPTRWIHDEGFPGSILDAYMSGVPVVASNWCHSKEFVNNGFSGFICDINRPEEFYERLEELKNDPVLLMQMKKNAFEESQKYSADSAFKIINVYM